MTMVYTPVGQYKEGDKVETGTGEEVCEAHIVVRPRNHIHSIVGVASVV